MGPGPTWANPSAEPYYMLNEQTSWPTIPGKFSWVNSSGGLGWPTVPVLEKIGVAGPPLIGSTYPSAYQQAPSTMASLYGRGAQFWWVIPTNCPDCFNGMRLSLWFINMDPNFLDRKHEGKCSEFWGVVGDAVKIQDGFQTLEVPFKYLIPERPEMAHFSHPLTTDY